MDTKGKRQRSARKKTVVRYVYQKPIAGEKGKRGPDEESGKNKGKKRRSTSERKRIHIMSKKDPKRDSKGPRARRSKNRNWAA